MTARQFASPSQRSISLLVALAVGIGATASAGCNRDKKREFIPAPRAKVDEPDGGDDAVPEDTGNATAAATGDGGVATGSGDGDGDGGAPGPSGPDVSGDLNKADAQALLTFLDVELKAGLEPKKLFAALARKCSQVGQCADATCRSVLATCGDDIGGCGANLLKSCPAFQAVAQGASGEELATRTETWMKDLWGDLIVKLRLSLPEKLQGRVDKVAERHQL